MLGKSERYGFLPGSAEKVASLLLFDRKSKSVVKELPGLLIFAIVVVLYFGKPCT